MWIKKTKSGKFKYVEQYTDYMTDKQMRVSITLDKKTPAAKKLAMETFYHMVEEKQSKPAESEECTLKELIEKYLENQKMTVKASTYSRNFHQCNFFLKIFDNNLKVNKLTPSYLKDTLLKTGQQPATLNEHRRRLLALLDAVHPCLFTHH